MPVNTPKPAHRPWGLPFRVRVALTLLLAWAVARLCVWLHTPIPWMIGPLVATALVSVLGSPCASWNPLRNGGQWVIGTALGLYFTPAVGALGFGTWLMRLHARHLTALSPAQIRSTTYFAGAIGGALEMTMIAERHGARTDRVAAAHSLRVLLVTLTIPFGMLAWGVVGINLAPPGAREVLPQDLALLTLCTLVGVLLMRWLGRAKPWFMGALLVTVGLTLSGLSWSAIPPGLSAAAQLVIGVSLGGRFTPAFVHTAPRWLASVALASGVMMAVRTGFAWLLSEVTVFQVCRLIAVLALAEPMYRRWVLPRIPTRAAEPPR